MHFTLWFLDHIQVYETELYVLITVQMDNDLEDTDTLTLVLFPQYLLLPYQPWQTIDLCMEIISIVSPSSICNDCSGTGWAHGNKFVICQ